jgi:putative ABC transport system substrate-binding protein
MVRLAIIMRMRDEVAVTPSLKQQILSVFALVLLGLTSHAFAQASPKLPRIGVLWPGDVAPYDAAFLEGLRDQGYVHGVTATIDIRSTGPDIESGARLAEELVALNPAVIFAVPATLARYTATAAQRAGTPIPIVVLAYDPVAEGVVDRAARPGGNITGVGGAHDPELITKLLQVVRDMVPTASRVVYLEDPTWGPTKAFPEKARTALERAGRQLKVSVTSVQLRAVDDIERAFANAARQRADAVLSTASPFVLTHRARIIELAAKYKLPTIYGDELFAKDGGLMSYWTSIADMHVRAANMTARILRGAKPSEIPVEYPARFRLVVNLRTAKALGLTIPNTVLIQADEVLN